MQAKGDLRGVRVAVLSRCARTLYKFRLPLLHALQSHGAGVVAYGAAGDGFERRLNEAGVAFCDMPVSLRGIDPLRDAALFVRYMCGFSRWKPEIVHAFTVKSAIYGTLAAWVVRVPVRIVTITGLGHAFTTGSTLLRSVVAALYRFALKRAHRVFFQNPDDLELFILERIVEARQTSLVEGSGVDLRVFESADLPYLRNRYPSFLMISRLLREKGVFEYVAAAAIVRRQYPDAKFRLLGSPDPRNPSSVAVSELAQTAPGVVEYVDEVRDVRPFIRDADVVVLPSYREGLPRTLLEAAAMGRAVITTDVPGCRQAIVPNETGILVKAASVESLTAAMELMIEKPEVICRYGKAGRDLACARFDEQLVIGTTIAAYSEVLSSLR